jgi:hypothetical protein
MMENIDKPTRCANTEQTKAQKLRSHFNQSAKRVKGEFIRLAVWWRIAWGTLI